MSKMVQLERFFYCRTIVIICILTLLRALSTCDAQPNPCISKLNLGEDDGGNVVQEGIYVFVTPGSRVAQGTDLSFLCCFYTGQEGLSFPSWTIEPVSNAFTEGTLPSPPDYNGKSLLYHTLNATATESINNTRVRCSSTRLFQSNWTVIILIGELPGPSA